MLGSAVFDNEMVVIRKGGATLVWFPHSVGEDVLEQVKNVGAHSEAFCETGGSYPRDHAVVDVLAEVDLTILELCGREYPWKKHH